MLKYDFEESVGYWTVMASRAVQRAVNDELAPLGITFRQCQALAWLALDGDLTQTELAERLQVEPPTLVPQLDRMEREGWIERAVCPEDRRKKMIRPRPEAIPIWRKIVGCFRKVRRQATRGFSAEETQTLKRLLAQVRENLGEAAPANAAESRSA